MRGQRQTKPPTASMPSNRHQGPPSGHPSIHPAIHPSARATRARCVLQHSTLRRGRTLAAQAAAPNPRTGMPCVQRAQLRALHEYCPYSVHAPTARFQATWRHGRQWIEGKARYPSPKVTLVLFTCRFSFSLGRSRPPIRPRPRPPHPPPLTGRLRVPTSLPRCNRSHLPASGGLRRRRRLQVGTRPPRPPFSSYRPNGLGAPPLPLPPPSVPRSALQRPQSPRSFFLPLPSPGGGTWPQVPSTLPSTCTDPAEAALLKPFPLPRPSPERKKISPFLPNFNTTLTAEAFFDPGSRIRSWTTHHLAAQVPSTASHRRYSTTSTFPSSPRPQARQTESTHVRWQTLLARASHLPITCNEHSRQWISPIC